ncbi:MAG: glutathione S-transferase family protein [Pikeienuella sp.]
MKIYEFDGFPNPARVRMAIAEKGLTDQVEFIQVDVPNGEHRTPEFLAKNPAGVVPVLELDDGTMIAECTAITEYLDRSDDAPTLTGHTAKERATVHMMQRRAEAEVLDAVAAYFHHATPGLGPDIEQNQCAEWGMIQRERAVKGMAYLDQVLSENLFLAGDQFSMADITAYAGLAFADFAGVPIAAEHSNLISWRERVGQRYAN